MADIFGRVDQAYGGGLSSDSLFLTFPAVAQSGLGLLIQRIGMEYRQRSRRIFELGPGLTGPGTADNGGLPSQPTYYVIERPEGRLNFGRIVGPNAICQTFYRTYGDPCNPNGTITLSGNAGCSAGGLGPLHTWTMRGVLVEGYNADLSAQESVIQEQATAQFVGFSLSIAGCAPTGAGAAGVGGGVQPFSTATLSSSGR